MCNDKDDDNNNDEGLTKIQLKMIVLMMMISTTVTIWPKVTNQIILILLNPFYSCATASCVFLGSVFFSIAPSFNVATRFLITMVAHWSREQYKTVNWDGGMPLDVSDFRARFSYLQGLFSGNLGLLYWVGILKIPEGRESFIVSYRLHSSVGDEKERIFKACQDACRKCANSVEKQQFDKECRWIRGPLKQHGFIEEMKRMHVIEKTDAPVKSSLQLGVSGFFYNICMYSSHAASAIYSICQLHMSIFAICQFGPPRTLKDWKKYRDLLAEAVVRFEVAGLNALKYCFDYSVRIFLDGLMYVERVPPLLL